MKYQSKNLFRDEKFLEFLLNLGRKIIPQPVFEFFQPWYHGILALSGQVFFGWPSRRLKVIGVTGTKGKSTTVFLIAKFLEEAGYKTAAIGSLGYKIGDREWPNNLKMTMPGRWKIQKFLAQAIKENCRFAVLEVTSEGIKQKRHWGLKFDTAVFTNLEKEHIESHGSFEKYYQAKQDLFKRTKNFHVLNADSPYVDPVRGKTPLASAGHAQGAGRTSNGVDLFSKFKAEKKVFYSLKDYNFESSLQGDFNKYNILAAAGAVKNYWVSPKIIQKALDKIKMIPGRMEFIPAFVKTSAGRETLFNVVVDYAHTPGSLEAVYKTLKEELSSPSTKLGTRTQINGRLICVLGACGGGRDRWKRSIFGRLAENYCDRIILTDEDPYDENPLSILKEIESGFSKSEIRNFSSKVPVRSRESLSKSEIILDRKEAIKKAMTIAQKNDIIVITGKGSENSMAVKGGRKIPWSDRDIVLEFLKELKK